MNWLEDLFFFGLRRNILVLNILLKLPEDSLFIPFNNARVNKQFYTLLLQHYNKLFNEHLQTIHTNELKKIISTFKNIINPQIEMDNTLSALFDLFRYYITTQFNLFYEYQKNYNILEKLDYNTISEVRDKIKEIMIMKASEVYKTFKNIIEKKYIRTKLESPFFVDNTVVFDLITDSGGTLTYDQLPDVVKTRMKNVLSHYEHDFIKNLLNCVQMQDLIRVGKYNLASDFKEKMIRIINTSDDDLKDMETQVLARRLKALFKEDTVSDANVCFLADNVQNATVDGRILLSQVAESLSGLKNNELNKVLQTIFYNTNLQESDLPNINLTGKECIFALAMEAISSSSSQPRNITLNVYGKRDLDKSSDKSSDTKSSS